MRLIKKLTLFSLFCFFIGGAIHGLSVINKNPSLLNNSKDSVFDIEEIQEFDTDPKLTSEGKIKSSDSDFFSKQKLKFDEETLKFQDLKIAEEQRWEGELTDTQGVEALEEVVVLEGEAITLVTEDYPQELYTGEIMGSLELGTQAVVGSQEYGKDIQDTDLGSGVEIDGDNSKDSSELLAATTSSSKKMNDRERQSRVFNMRVGLGGSSIHRLIKGATARNNQKGLAKVLNRAVKI